MKNFLLVLMFFLVNNIYAQKTFLLHDAVAGNKYIKIEFALKTGSDVNALGRFKYYTPLMIAVRNGNLKFVKLLIKYGAKLDIKDGDWDKHYTALLYAIDGNYVKIVKYLLKKGAKRGIACSPSYKGGKAITARDLARNKPSLDYLFIDPSELLLQFTKANDLKGIIRSLKLGAKINVKDKNGWTPLMIAMGEGYKSISRYIKRRGGKTAFELSAKIIYNSNGATSGTVPIDHKSYRSGKQVVLLGNLKGDLRKKGMRFSSWKDSSGKTFLVGSRLTMGIKNIVLYAKWSPMHKVVYSRSTWGRLSTSRVEGLVPIDKKKYIKGNKVPVLAHPGKLKVKGYAFGGWGIRDSFRRVKIVSQFVMDNKDVTLYAKWIPEYKVTYKSYKSTDGVVPIDKKKYLEGDQVTILSNVGKLKKKGYLFGGWAEFRSKVLPAGSKLGVGRGNVTLLAKWIPEVTYESYESTEGVVPIDKKKYLKGDQITILDNVGKLKRKGYSFGGWKKEGSYDNSKALRAGSKIKMGENRVTLQVNWVRVYKVIYTCYDITSGTVPIDKKEYLNGDQMIVLGNIGKLKKKGYSFGGWKRRGKVLQVGSKMFLHGSIYLAATWVYNR